MLTVSHLTKSFELQTLFENISFQLNPGERTGLIGPNGCGKTTLLRILAGFEPATSGRVSRDPALRIGYLPQNFDPGSSGGIQGGPESRHTFAPATLGEIIGRAAGSAAALEDELAEAAAALAEAARSPGDPRRAAELEARYDELLRRIQAADTGRAAEILAGLGLAGSRPQPAGQPLERRSKDPPLLSPGSAG